jgi:glucose/arabinose dehydrogenase
MPRILLLASLLASALLLPAAERVPFKGSKVVGTPEPPPPYRARRVLDRVAFKSPLYVLSHPKHERLFVVEQQGKIVSMPLGAEKADPFLTLPGHEFYAMTFHPKYADNGLAYVFANTALAPGRRKNVLLRFKVTGDPPACDLKSKATVIEWESNGHNGGDLGFAADGMLYITSGDGTSDSDENRTGQDLSDLNSGILRIDVDAPGKPYAVPKDNPFLTVKGARPELWAFGLRNPWRMHIDPATNDLYIGDVGQDASEMVYLGKKGANYGWAIREGTRPFHTHLKPGPGPFTDPLIEHSHSESRSLTGGIVYRGKKLPELRGAYVYGDYSTGRIWGLRQKGGKVTWKGDVARTRLQIVGFGTGPDGELYLADLGGQIHTLEKAPPAPPGPAFPRRLSQTGLFSSVKGHRPAAGTITYDVLSPLWSDGADKERFIALPGASRLTFSNRGFWGFPEQTVLVKTFRLAGKRVETRLLHLNEGEWVGYSYAWSAEQDDAALVADGGRDDDDVLGTGKKWRYPSRSECMMCHTRAANYVLGLCTAQMSIEQLREMERLGVFTVPASEQAAAWRERGEALAALIRPRLPKWAWSAVGRLGSRIRAPKRDLPVLPVLPEEMPRLARPDDDSAPLDLRARSYLHANCAHCHVWAGGGNSAIDLHFATPPEKRKYLNASPMHGPQGAKDARIIAPGAPERSVLYLRLTKRGRGQMPPLASHASDLEGARLIERWIRGMK